MLHERSIRHYASQMQLATVRGGDDWWSLSRRLGIPLVQLRMHNPFLATRALRGGAADRLPAGAALGPAGRRAAMATSSTARGTATTSSTSRWCWKPTATRSAKRTGCGGCRRCPPDRRCGFRWRASGSAARQRPTACRRETTSAPSPAGTIRPPGASSVTTALWDERLTPGRDAAHRGASRSGRPTPRTACAAATPWVRWRGATAPACGHPGRQQHGPQHRHQHQGSACACRLRLRLRRRPRSHRRLRLRRRRRSRGRVPSARHLRLRLRHRRHAPRRAGRQPDRFWRGVTGPPCGPSRPPTTWAAAPPFRSARACACRHTASAASAAVVTHRVQRGDTLGKIAERYGTSVRAIQAATTWAAVRSSTSASACASPTEAAAARRAERADRANCKGRRRRRRA